MRIRWTSPRLDNTREGTIGGRRISVYVGTRGLDNRGWFASITVDGSERHSSSGFSGGATAAWRWVTEWARNFGNFGAPA